MITNAIFSIFEGLVNVFLAPLEIINIGINFITPLAAIRPFLEVIAYLFPFSNIVPLIILSLTILGIKITISIITFVMKFIPRFRWIERSFI